ncbi:MAG: peptidoglycan-associated lipoprotein Pal [Pseudomonadota bacterium]
MLKKFLTLSAVLLLVSCQSKTKSDDLRTEDKAATQVDTKGSYQTIEGEQQANALNQQVPVQEIEVQDRVLFGYDSADLTDDAKKILDTQVSWLKSDAGIKITIEGHCDERGTREYNIALGEKRANAAKKYLTSNGVDAARIKIISYGKERPAFFGTSEEVLAKNRRAVTVVN